MQAAWGKRVDQRPLWPLILDSKDVSITELSQRGDCPSRPLAGGVDTHFDSSPLSASTALAISSSSSSLSSSPLSLSLSLSVPPSLSPPVASFTDHYDAKETPHGKGNE